MGTDKDRAKESEELMSMLKPSSSWRAELKPALPDLEERAKRVVFWREIKSVRVFRDTETDSLKASFAMSLQDSIRASLEASLRDALQASAKASSLDLQRATLFSQNLGSFVTSLRASFRATLDDSLGRLIATSVGDSLFFSASFVFSNKLEEAMEFKPLLELWLAGNFPVAFDKEGNLLVLVADPHNSNA